MYPNQFNINKSDFDSFKFKKLIYDELLYIFILSI